MIRVVSEERVMSTIYKIANARLIDLVYGWKKKPQNIYGTKITFSLMLGLLFGVLSRDSVETAISDIIISECMEPLLSLVPSLFVQFLAPPFLLYISLSMLIETQHGSNGKYENKVIICFFSAGFLFAQFGAICHGIGNVLTLGICP